MPRKIKTFTSQRREAQKLYQQGKKKEAHALWLKVAEGRAKFKEDKKKRSLARRGLV